MTFYMDALKAYYFTVFEYLYPILVFWLYYSLVPSYQVIRWGTRSMRRKPLHGKIYWYIINGSGISYKYKEVHSSL